MSVKTGQCRPPHTLRQLPAAESGADEPLPGRSGEFVWSGRSSQRPAFQAIFPPGDFGWQIPETIARPSGYGFVPVGHSRDSGRRPLPTSRWGRSDGPARPATYVPADGRRLPYSGGRARRRLRSNSEYVVYGRRVQPAVPPTPCQ